MIRSMQTTDLPDLLALLHWMDDAPEREVFAPSSRDVQELQLECEDNTCLVDVNEDGVAGFCAISPFRDGLVLEGPLSESGQVSAVLKRVLAESEGLSVYAFCSRENAAVRDALESAGLTPMHSTAFYSIALKDMPEFALPDGYAVTSLLPLTDYRALYKAAEDAWATRLDWTPEQFDAHFARDDVKLIALTRSGKPAAFAELEFHPDDARAEVTYLAVHPAERGQHLGRALLSLAAQAAAQNPAMRTLRARAHDHMHAARTLYSHAGLKHCRSIVTYMLEGEEEA